MKLLDFFDAPARSFEDSDHVFHPPTANPSTEAVLLYAALTSTEQLTPARDQLQ